MWNESRTDGGPPRSEGSPDPRRRSPPNPLTLLRRPGETFDRLAVEPAPLLRVWVQYAAPLALTPAFFRALGLRLFGARDASGAFTVGTASAVLDFGLGWGLILASTLALGGVIRLSAWGLGAPRSYSQTLSLAVYASTGGWIGGVFLVAPPLWPLASLMALYDVYLLWRGAAAVFTLDLRRRLLFMALTIVGAAAFQTLSAQLVRLALKLL